MGNTRLTVMKGCLETSLFAVLLWILYTHCDRAWYSGHKLNVIFTMNSNLHPNVPKL